MTFTNSSDNSCDRTCSPLRLCFTEVRLRLESWQIESTRVKPDSNRRFTGTTGIRISSRVQSPKTRLDSNLESTLAERDTKSEPESEPHRMEWRTSVCFKSQNEKQSTLNWSLLRQRHVSWCRGFGLVAIICRFRKSFRSVYT